MKKKFNFIFCILLFIGIISGCSSNTRINNQELTENISVIADSIESIGILHNQGLDYALAALQKEKRQLFKESGIQITKESPSDMKKRFLNAGYDTLKSFLRNSIPSAGDADIERLINRDDFASGKINGAEKGNEFLQSIPMPFVIKYYGKLLMIVNDPALSSFQLDEKIRTLEQQIKAEAPGVEEARIILSVTITSRYSTYYWAGNLKKWKSLLNPIVIYAGLTPEENDAVAGMLPGLYNYPSDSTKYIMIRPDHTVSVEQCPCGEVFYERIQSCMPPEHLNSMKTLPQYN